MDFSVQLESFSEDQLLLRVGLVQEAASSLTFSSSCLSYMFYNQLITSNQFYNTILFRQKKESWYLNYILFCEKSMEYCCKVLNGAFPYSDP